MLDIINAIQTYVDTTASPKSLAQPIVRFYALAEPIEGCIEVRTFLHPFTMSKLPFTDPGLWLDGYENTQFARLRKSV